MRTEGSVIVNGYHIRPENTRSIEYKERFFAADPEYPMIAPESLDEPMMIPWRVFWSVEKLLFIAIVCVYEPLC